MSVHSYKCGAPASRVPQPATMCLKLEKGATSSVEKTCEGQRWQLKKCTNLHTHFGSNTLPHCKPGDQTPVPHTTGNIDKRNI